MRVRPQPRGFSLLELGMVLAVIGVLVAAVLTGRGFVNAAKMGSAGKLLESLQKSGRVWSERERAGLDFNGISAGVLPGVPPGLETPWGASGAEAITVSSTSDPSGSCAAETCMRTCIQVPDAQTCASIRQDQLARAIAVTCAAGCGAQCLCVISR
jgi:prepilin-type N-terminal cleavage/methylation domain-containing protein